MGVVKSGSRFRATLKHETGDLLLGHFECRECAKRVVQVANGCLSSSIYRQHGADPECVREAIRLGIAEIIENHMGIKLSESEALRQQEQQDREYIEFMIERALHAESVRNQKRKAFFESRQILKAIPLLEVEYPPVPLASVPVTKYGDGLPESSGVYFVWYEERIVYVGQSVCIKNRATLHHEKIFGDERVSWLGFNRSVLNYAESFYIGVVCPTRNFGSFQKVHEDEVVDFATS